ncbi:MAG: hypothetical protein U0Q12_11560 [Vicinamibacterales bacterium]
MLREQERQQVSEMLKAMTSPVKLVLFTQTFGCDSCGETKRLLDDVVSLNPLLSLVEHNLVLDKEKAAQYGVDRAPIIALEGDGDARIRFVGGPFGYEFSSLLQSILAVSSRESGLSPASKTLIASVRTPVTLQVFSTPT